MTDKAKSAELILRLYELRREDVMRQARNWFFSFNPQSVDDIVKAVMGEHSAYFRMVASYWDMACSFVNHGAIDPEMFADANGEQVLVFTKLQPFLEEMRAQGSPMFLRHLEKQVMEMPQAEERISRMREMLKRMSQAQAAAAAEQTEAEAANA